jgi:hypothetical protein
VHADGTKTVLFPYFNPILCQKAPLFRYSEPLICAMSDSGEADEAAHSNPTEPMSVDHDEKDGTDAPDTGTALDKILRNDYSMYVKSWREPVDRKSIKIDEDKKHGQIRHVNWDDVTRKAEFNMISKPSGPFQCTLWEDPQGVLWCISGQHTVLAIEQCVKHQQTLGLPLAPWHKILHADILKYDTPLMIRRKIAGHSQERTEAVTPLSLADTAANLLMTNADEPELKDIDAFDVRILDVLEMCAKVHRVQFNDDKYKVLTLHSVLSLRCTRSILLLPANCAQHTSAPFQAAETKKWRAFMNFVYWGGEDAVQGIRQLEAKMSDEKHRLSLNGLKCLESVWLPQFHMDVAHHLLRQDATVKTLSTFVADVRKRQWIHLHLRHPENKLIKKAGGMPCSSPLSGASCVRTPRGLAVSLACATYYTYIPGLDAATAALMVKEITVNDLKCNLGQWRYWPSAGKKGQQWGPFPDWKLLKRALLWHKTWSDEDQRKVNPSRHLGTAISEICVGPSRREPVLTGDGVAVITTTETGPTGDVFEGISLRLCTTPNMTTPPEKRLLDMKFDLIFVDPRLLLMQDDPTALPQWLWDLMKEADTVAYGDTECLQMMNDGVQRYDAWHRWWRLPLYLYKKSPKQGDDWKTDESAVWIWSPANLPTFVCPVCLFAYFPDVSLCIR